MRGCAFQIWWCAMQLKSTASPLQQASRAMHVAVGAAEAQGKLLVTGMQLINKESPQIVQIDVSSSLGGVPGISELKWVSMLQQSDPYAVHLFHWVCWAHLKRLRACSSGGTCAADCIYAERDREQGKLPLLLRDDVFDDAKRMHAVPGSDDFYVIYGLHGFALQIPIRSDAVTMPMYMDVSVEAAEETKTRIVEEQAAALMLAFAMGAHARLGAAASPVCLLCDNVVCMIRDAVAESLGKNDDWLDRIASDPETARFE